MTASNIWRYIISFVFLLATVKTIAQQDTISPVKKSRPYAIRIGYDIGKKIWSGINRGNIDEIHLQFSRRKNIIGFYAGTERMPYVHPEYQFVTKGRYIKIEYAYNFYENWGDMHNAITLGFRYGRAFFDYHITSVSTAPQAFWPQRVMDTDIRYNNLNAHWLETTASVKTEIFHGFFLELYVSGKYFLNGSHPANFDILYIPGFYRTNISRFGFGLGYGISYRIGL